MVSSHMNQVSNQIGWSLNRLQLVLGGYQKGNMPQWWFIRTKSCFIITPILLFSSSFVLSSKLLVFEESEIIEIRTRSLVLLFSLLLPSKNSTWWFFNSEIFEKPNWWLITKKKFAPTLVTAWNDLDFGTEFQSLFVAIFVSWWQRETKLEYFVTYAWFRKKKRLKTNKILFVEILTHLHCLQKSVLTLLLSTANFWKV